MVYIMKLPTQQTNCISVAFTRLEVL